MDNEFHYESLTKYILIDNYKKNDNYSNEI